MPDGIFGLERHFLVMFMNKVVSEPCGRQGPCSRGAVAENRSDQNNKCMQERKMALKDKDTL